MSVSPASPPSSGAMRPTDSLPANREFRQLLRRTTLTLLVVLLAPMLVLGGLVALLRDSAHWVDHTDQVIAEINQVEKLLITMQSGFRGFRLMKESSELASYRQARAEIDLHLATLAALTSDNPMQAAAVPRLRADKDRWVAYAETALSQLAAGRKPEELLPDMLGARAIMNSAVSDAHDMITEEARLRILRDARLNTIFTTFLSLLAVAALLGIPIFAFWLQRVLRKVGGLYQASRDAAERRAQELQVTLSSIGDAVIATDAQGRVDFLNPVAETLMGWSNAEARGRPLTEVFAIFNEDTGLPTPNPVERVLRENIIVGLANHTVLRSRDGREHPIEDSAAPIRDEQGGMLGVILVFHDVSASRAAERQREATAERFRVLSAVVALQVWTATPAGELDYANQECAEYFGGDIGRDVLGHAWAQFVHPDDLPAALKAWQAALATGQRYEVEFRLRNHAGVFRWFLVRAQALRGSDGAIVKWFGTNTDIDALKRAQDAVVQASRAKDDFLAALSHELRTPLTPVLLTAAALREDGSLPAEVRDQLGMMERNIALEARLIDDLLDLTTISRGKLQLRAQPCDAHSLIGLAIEIVREDARTKEITIERAFNARHHGIVADPARFQQIIWNVLRNAVKFTPRGGRIAIHTREETITGVAWLRIEVSDSGIGIDPVLLGQIFQPFDQGGLTGDHRFGGLGLGLAIARAVVDLHGGRISAHSAGVNRGATFVIEFPGAIAPPAGSAGVAASRPASPAVKPQRLLLVEDHENTLQTLQRLLERDGHHVTTAGTVAEGLAAAAVHRFDLVISDLGLPDGTGNELMEKLRSLHGLRGLALSGYGMDDDIARSQQAGFVAHLVKPVVFAELQRVLAALPPA